MIYKDVSMGEVHWGERIEGSSGEVSLERASVRFSSKEVSLEVVDGGLRYCPLWIRKKYFKVCYIFGRVDYKQNFFNIKL